MNVTIQKPVGGTLLTGGSTSPMAMSVYGSSSYSAPNDPSDVSRIQELLNLLAASRVAIPVTGRCGRETVDAITDFQRLYRGMPDGKVDPGGLTLARMNAVATALKLEEPNMTSPDYGAYVLKYTGTRPPEPYRVLLNVCPLQPAALVAGRPLDPEAQYCMEVTTSPSTWLLSKDNLGEFLSLVEKRGLWADNKAALRLIVVRDTQVISVSTPQQFKPPVKPWAKKVTPTELGQGDDGPKLKYIGTGESPFIGRYFYSKKIGDKYYWKYGAALVTEQQYRGFDCITFVGSLYLKDPATGGNNPFGSSANMASALNATPVAWKSAELIEAEKKEAAMTEAEKKKVAAMTEAEKKREAERKKKFAEENQVKDGEGKGTPIKKYFAQASGNTGTYLLWKGSHITLVIAKKVHEFAHSKGGYSVTDVANWVGDSVDYHLYSLPADKQF